MASQTLHLVSLGCTKNLVDSEVMLGQLSDYTLTDDPQDADVIIVNTCGFIDAAKEESLSTVLELDTQRKSDSLLVMSGCLSERYRQQLQEELPEVDIFTGVGDYARIDELIAKRQSRFSPEVYLAAEHATRLVTGSRYHAYIKIAEGCNQTCAFCAIPGFKGRLHSRTIASIVAEVRQLVDGGCWDFSFVAQDTSSYGRDLGMVDGLIDLIDAVEQIPGVRSARIHYLYPSTTTFALIDRIADSPLFHTYYDLPIQHIHDGVLRTMKRGFGADKTIALLMRMRSKPDSFIRTSVIAGHPGESEEAFEQLCDFMEDFGFDRFNTFHYSNEEDTVAYTMEQIPPATIDARAKRLGEIAQASMQRSLEAQIGRTVTVVIDGPSDEHEYLLSARPLSWAVEIDGEILINDTNDIAVQYGHTYPARITGQAGDKLLGTLLQA